MKATIDFETKEIHIECTKTLEDITNLLSFFPEKIYEGFQMFIKECKEGGDE